MKTHTSSFKEQIKLIGKEIDSRITFGSTVLGKDDLNAVTPSYQGAILKSVMKQLDIDSNVEIPIGTILKYEFGLKVNGEYEYINYGNYVVYSIEKQEDTNSYKITCYDKLLYSMLDYVKLPITYPISIRDYINSLSTALGLKFANKSETFANYDKQIQADLYDGLGYTFRDVLDELAQVTASTICLNNNDELEIRYITETNDTIDEEFLKDVNVNFGEKFGAVNTIVLSRSGDSDSVYYPSVLPSNPYEIKISDNQIMNGNDRADFLPDIYNKLNGLEFYTNDFVSTGICYYDLCDRYSVKVGDNTYSCVMFNDEVLVTQGLEENVYTELPEQTETDYKHASKDDRMINQVYIIAKKNEAEILALVSTTETIQKEINPTKDESGSEIIIEDASNNPLTYLEIEGKSTQATRSGKNLFNINTATLNSALKWADGTYYTENLSVASDFIKIEKGKSYISKYKMQIILFNENKEYIGYYNTTTGQYNGFTISNDSECNYVKVSFRSSSNNNVDFTTIGDIQLEQGTQATSYEPYGVSPSPDYPSEIESVGYENLFDKDNTTYKNGYYKGDNGEEISTSYSGYITSYVSVQPNTIYTISGKLKGITNTGAVYFYDNLKNWISRLSNANLNEGEFTFTTPNNCYYMQFQYIMSVYDASTIQITKGTKIYNYIPYGKYGIEVKTVGKNKLNINHYEMRGDGLGFDISSLEIGKTYTFSSNKPITILKISNYSWNYNSIYYVDRNGFYNYTFVMTRNENIPETEQQFLFLQITKTEDTFVKNISELDGYEIQIEESVVATNYDPFHKPMISLIELNAPLRSLPNGVKDELVIENGRAKIIKRVGKVVLNGTENWEKEVNDTYISISNAKGNATPTLSNYFKSVSTNTNVWGDIKFGATNNNLIFYKGAIENTDLAGFKTWLSTHNTQVDYELAEPYTEELGEIEMPSTYKGTTYIQTTDNLEPNLNITYVRDTVISDYVENHVAELKITESEIKSSVETVSSSVDGLNSTVNRVEEITNDNSQVLNIISTNIDRTSGEVREVTTTTGFTFNAEGMAIADGSGFKAQHTAQGTFYKDGDSITGQYTKDGSKQKDLELFGTYSYGKNDINDTPMFVAQLYIDEKGEECFGHFINI